MSALLLVLLGILATAAVLWTAGTIAVETAGTEITSNPTARQAKAIVAKNLPSRLQRT